ncbi:hypothetical protein BE73_09230 [Xanthomonas oryzae pv. oryzicola]|nr:hypothetical protein BE73_09230 [Xanthomonas oryzae pv. oryzicola]
MLLKLGGTSLPGQKLPKLFWRQALEPFLQLSIIATVIGFSVALRLTLVLLHENTNLTSHLVLFALAGHRQTLLCRLRKV